MVFSLYADTDLSGLPEFSVKLHKSKNEESWWSISAVTLGYFPSSRQAGPFNNFPE